MSITRLSGGLTPADGSDPRTFPAIFNNAADEVDAKVVKDVSAGQTFVIWAELNSASPSAGDNMGLGAGATNTELTMPVAGSITKLSVSVVTPSGTNTLQLVKNGTLQGSGFQVSTAAASAVATLATPLAFAAGDTINLQFTAAGGGPVVGLLFGFWD